MPPKTFLPCSLFLTLTKTDQSNPADGLNSRTLMVTPTRKTGASRAPQSSDTITKCIAYSRRPATRRVPGSSWNSGSRTPASSTSTWRICHFVRRLAKGSTSGQLFSLSSPKSNPVLTTSHRRELAPAPWPRPKSTLSRDRPWPLLRGTSSGPRRKSWILPGAS